MIIIIFLIISVTSILSLNSRMKVTQQDYSTMSCVGNAENSLVSNRVSIVILVQTTNITSEQSLKYNSNITRAVITALTTLGINEKNDTKTISFSVNPQYKSVYNQTTKSDDSILIGYQVSNTLGIKTKDTASTGKLIDAAVKAGAIVSSISFDVTESVAKSAKMNLIKSAIDDCKNQFKNALEPIGYKVGDYITISIDDLEPASSRQFNGLSLAGPFRPNVTPGKNIIKIKIFITIKISK